MTQQFNPPHPGGFITRNYLPHLNISSNELARRLRVSPSTLNRVLNENSAVSPEMAIKLSLVLGRTAESWIAMQSNYDLAQARKSIRAEDYSLMALV
jgi:addiction module HigA family antidote